MSDTSDAPETSPAESTPALPRRIADAYVDQLAELDPITGQYLGLNPGDDRLPDFSPDGLDALAELSRRTLAELDAAEASGAPAVRDDAERRCAKLLRERLTAGLAVHEAGEGLRAVSNLHSPVHSVREVFQLMPTASGDDWAAIAGRLRAIPRALAGYRDALRTGDDIVAVSGATISSRAMAVGVRRALVLLDELMLRPERAGTATASR